MKSKLKQIQYALQIKIPIGRSWEMNFRRFRGLSYDYVIYRDDFYLWTNGKMKIKGPDLNVGNILNPVDSVNLTVKYWLGIFSK